MSGQTPTIALCLIARDEENNLHAFLAAVKDHFDEILLVDTGSRDKTPQIARDFGASVYITEWKDHFGDARNVSLSHCVSDWIFVLDPDERVEDERYSELRALIKGPMDCVYRFETRNICDRSNAVGWKPFPGDHPLREHGKGAFPSRKIRLFPNHRGIEFSGRVHELVSPSVEALGFRIENAPIRIDHFGECLPPDRIREKDEFYLRLGKMKVAEERDNPKSHFELGNQLLELGMDNEAETSYRRVLELAPDWPPALHQLAGIMAKTGKIEEGILLLKRAVSVDKKNISIRSDLGVVLVKSGDCDQAREHLDCAIQTLGHRPSVLYARARVHEVDGESDSALKLLMKCVLLEPDNFDALDYLSQLSLKSQATLEVLVFLRDTAGSHPDSLPLMVTLGELSLSAGKTDEAIGWYELASGIDSNNPRLNNDLGVYQYSLGNLKEAVRYLKKALEADPTQKEARDNLKSILDVIIVSDS